MSAALGTAVGLFYAKPRVVKLNSQVVDAEISNALTRGETSGNQRFDAASSISRVPLPLQLFSTTPTSAYGEGNARIGIADARPQTYEVGSRFSNGAQLAGVFADHVILVRNGERLVLYKAGVNEAAPQSDESSSLAFVGAEPDMPPPPLVDRTVADYIRSNPVYNGQQMLGIEVYPARQSTIFHQLGLKSGDVLTTINGAALSDPSVAYEALRMLEGGSTLSVSLKRRNRTIDLVLSGNAISQARLSE